MKGKVKFFNAEKGFGFITGEDGVDYYVHNMEIVDGASINTDDSVTFETTKGDRGMKAVKVSKS